MAKKMQKERWKQERDREKIADKLEDVVCRFRTAKVEETYVEFSSFS